ncbi:MAG TPA: hypothetical protein VFT79_07145 [Solirubrobacterales bacterium]|nr:hypothetical protein [Solirubrobacterales bacterium]
MGKVFEVFGYPAVDEKPAAEESRRGANCPFMDGPCDGGGNRHLSNLDLAADPELEEYFEWAPSPDHVPAGICSIRPSIASDPWIVCPRRLLVLGRQAAGERRCQVEIERLVVELFEYAPGTRLGVWPEVKLKGKDPLGQGERRFDQTFDYILMPLGDLDRKAAPGLDWKNAEAWERAGYRVEADTIHDAPVGAPAVLEIMTSSTSGGNKEKGTTIPMAFRRTIIDGHPAEGPGINYRQVWARMASQLVVKSEIAVEWGGAALWVLQDVLARYISDTTGLDLAPLQSNRLGEVNILSLSYGGQGHEAEGVIELADPVLYAGPIAGAEGSLEHGYGFLDIVRAGVKPSRHHLLSALLRRPPANEILVS